MFKEKVQSNLRITCQFTGKLQLETTLEMSAICLNAVTPLAYCWNCFPNGPCCSTRFTYWHHNSIITRL